MNNTRFDAVLDALTPTHILTPITLHQQDFQKIVYVEEQWSNTRGRKVEISPYYCMASSSEDDDYVERNTYDDGDDSMKDQDDSNLSRGERETLKFRRRFKRGVKHFNRIENIVDASSQCYWKASSYKAAHPIENALNDDPESFWQSDGGQPHVVDIYFNKRVELAMLALFFGFEVDESYSPSVMKIYIGDSINDLTYFEEWHMNRSTQWFAKKFPSYPFKMEKKPCTYEEKDKTLPVKCQVIRLSFPLNHDNGKDTHLRGIRIYTKDDGYVPVAPIKTETKTKNTDRVLGTMFPKSKFNDGYFSVR